MFKHINSLLAVALGAASASTPVHHMGRTRYIGGRRCTNRYHPHQGAREIARRRRQKERLRDKYMMNGGFSRRGNEVGPI